MSDLVAVDEHGCPTEMDESGNYAKHLPASPCRYCTGNSDLRHHTEDRKMTSWEWCQYYKTCAATINWDSIYGAS